MPFKSRSVNKFRGDLKYLPRCLWEIHLVLHDIDFQYERKNAKVWMENILGNETMLPVVSSLQRVNSKPLQQSLTMLLKWKVKMISEPNKHFIYTFNCILNSIYV